MSTIPYGRQDFNQADIDAVVSVLRSDFLTDQLLSALPVLTRIMSA